VAERFRRRAPFPGNRAITGNYCHFRKRLVEKTGDTSLLTVRLYDFRHYYANILYHKTKDILHVKQQLGHRRLENTLIYTHLVDFPDDEWICKVAQTVSDAQGLIETDFEYVTEMNDFKLFRKRK